MNAGVKSGAKKKIIVAPMMVQIVGEVKRYGEEEERQRTVGDSKQKKGVRLRWRDQRIFQGKRAGTCANGKTKW